MTVLNLQVTASTDDARQNGVTMDLTAANIVVNATDNWAGLRFLNVTIPKNSTISAATLQLYSPDTVSDDPNDDIYCEAADNAVTFGTGDSDISNRSRTTSPVSWVATGVGGAAWITSPDIASQVQQVVNRAGWVSGNALVVIFDHTGTPDWRWRAYNGDVSLAAKLDITYTAPATGNPWYAYAQQGM